MGSFIDRCLNFVFAKATGKKTFSTNPHIGLLLNAAEEDLIADELFLLGTIYRKGAYLVPTDEKKANDYNLKAANKGHVIAQFMESMQLFNENAEKDKILYWMKKASDQGEPQSMYNLAVSLHRGDLGMCKDNDDSFRLFRMSAEKRNISACVRIAQMYANGDEIERNIPLARYWYLQAAQQTNNNIDIIKALSDLVTDREIINGKFNNVVINDDAVQNGEPDALVGYGINVFESHDAKDEKMLREAVEKGSYSARYLLGEYLLINDINIKEAETLLTEAAEKGFKEAQFLLANLYYEGKIEFKSDIKKSLFWIEKSLNWGFPPARRLFSTMISEGKLQEILPDKVCRAEHYLEMYSYYEGNKSK